MCNRVIDQEIGKRRPAHCGEHAAANSSNPPATISSDFVIVVTSKVLENGSTISGDIKQIVAVH